MRTAILTARWREGLWRLLNEERGIAAIEYALIAFLIAVVIVGAVQVTGTNLASLFTKVGDEF